MAWESVNSLAVSKMLMAMAINLAAFLALLFGAELISIVAVCLARISFSYQTQSLRDQAPPPCFVAFTIEALSISALHSANYGVCISYYETQQRYRAP